MTNNDRCLYGNHSTLKMNELCKRIFWMYAENLTCIKEIEIRLTKSFWLMSSMFFLSFHSIEFQI